MPEHAAQLRDHWWPRPGWRPGRIMLTWHITFDGAIELQRHVERYQEALCELPGLNPVPVEWLHLTIQGVGYTDETDSETVPAVVEAVRRKVSTVPAFDLTFGDPVIYGEAIAIRPEPAEPLQQLLIAIRSGLATVLGEDQVPTGPEQAHGFHPHVSLAYSHVNTDAEPYRRALAAVNDQAVTTRVSEVTLIRQERQLEPHWLYRWTTEATASLSA